jgi:hypothetical protein
LPSSIAIDQTTRRLLGDLFEYHDLGAIEAKGFSNRVQAYEVVRLSMVESRFEALRTAAIPLVGRTARTSAGPFSCFAIFGQGLHGWSEITIAVGS